MIIHILPTEGVTKTQLKNFIQKHLKNDSETWSYAGFDINLNTNNGIKKTPAFKHIKKQYESETVFFKNGVNGVYVECYPMKNEGTTHMLLSMIIYTLTYNLSYYIDDITISL